MRDVFHESREDILYSRAFGAVCKLWNYRKHLRKSGLKRLISWRCGEEAIRQWQPSVLDRRGKVSTRGNRIV